MIWRQMGEGTYSLALEPGTNRAVARDELRRSGELLFLEPGQGRSYDLELGVLAGAAEIDAFAGRVEAVSRAVSPTG